MDHPMHSTVYSSPNRQNMQLTDEQLDLVSRLSGDNVAVADIARLVERMRRGRSPRGQGMESSDTINGMTQEIDPPCYDSLDTQDI